MHTRIQRWKHRLLNEKGLTLIELIIFIVVSSIISVGLMGVYVSLVTNAVTIESLAQANYLGQQKLEELTKFSFVDSNLVIQDYTYEPAAGTGYEWSWKVEYVDGNSLLSSASDTKYKKITVKVRDSGGTELEYYTLVTKRFMDVPGG
ncbi:MAG: prepilin-type N-terminal cleavage/methylation domain-containing protein [bacterium]